MEEGVDERNPKLKMALHVKIRLKATRHAFHVPCSRYYFPCKWSAWRELLTLLH